MSVMISLPAIIKTTFAQAKRRSYMLDHVDVVPLKCFKSWNYIENNLDSELKAKNRY